MDAAAIPVVETDRLLLRGPTPEDTATWARALDEDRGFLKYVPSRVGTPSAERAERLVGSYLRRWDAPLGMAWSVTLKDGGTFIGFAGVDAASETDGEIEYLLARPYWRQGYASEVAAAVTDYWFETTNGQRLVAYAVPANVGSVRAVAKLGYERTGSIDYLELMGNPEGIVLESPEADEYSLTREAWRAARA